MEALVSDRSIVFDSWRFDRHGRTLGSNLRRRVAAGLTQKELADRALMPQQYISEIENGTMNITLNTLTALATAIDGYAIEMWPATAIGRAIIRSC